MLLFLVSIIALLIIFVNIWLFPILHEKSHPEGGSEAYKRFVIETCFPTGEHHFVLSFFSFGFLKRSWKQCTYRLKRAIFKGKYAKYGESAPHAQIVSMAGDAMDLKDYFDKFSNIPIIINMGSYS